MSKAIAGIHHVTAIAADAQTNIDFYCGVLGLRLVKLTVNFDDPESYHLYYGDELGRPGTIMTFFAWPLGRRGRIGPPQVSTTGFVAPAESMEYWADRLRQHDLDVAPRASRFGEPVLAFADPDGLNIEIVGVEQAPSSRMTGGPVPVEHTLRAFHSVAVSEEGYESTARLLTEFMGFRPVGEEGNRFRYRAAGDGNAATVDVLCVPDAPRGSMGTGVVHHIAFRTADLTQLEAWREAVVERRLNVSPVMDRSYFKSIYFREPGGVLFEIATDSPGFTVDESPDALATALKLPPQHEHLRDQIERLLPPLTLPKWNS